MNPPDSPSENKPASAPPAAGNIFNAEQPAPAYGTGKMSEADDRLWCILAHLISIIVLLVKRGQSPAVDAHWKAALNFNLTTLIVCIGLSILSNLPGVGLLFGLVSSLVSLAALVFAIIAMLKAKEGRLFRYPFSLQLIK